MLASPATLIQGGDSSLGSSGWRQFSGQLRGKSHPEVSWGRKRSPILEAKTIFSSIVDKMSDFLRIQGRFSVFRLTSPKAKIRQQAIKSLGLSKWDFSLWDIGECGSPWNMVLSSVAGVQTLNVMTSREIEWKLIIHRVCFCGVCIHGGRHVCLHMCIHVCRGLRLMVGALHLIHWGRVSR